MNRNNISYGTDTAITMIYRKMVVGHDVIFNTPHDFRSKFVLIGQY